MSDFPSNFTVSSRILKSVIPLALKNFAAILVPVKYNTRKIREHEQGTKSIKEIFLVQQSMQHPVRHQASS
jgi:hypothetical protein